MISEQRTAVILLSITILFLVYYLVVTYFRTHDVIGETSREPIIRIHPLNILPSRDISKKSSKKPTIRVTPLRFEHNLSPIDIALPSISTSPEIDSDLAGQNLDLDKAHSLQIRMYGDREFLGEQYSFDASDKVFLVMEFSQLEAGEHHILVLWKAPNGQPINSSRHTISLTRRSPKHRTFFWLKLIKNGMFTEMFTGAEYKGDIHGIWDAEIYFDSDRITSQKFMIRN